MKVPVKGVVVFSLGAIIGFLANGLLSIDEQLDEDAEERSYQEGSLDSQVVYLSKHGKAFHRIDCPSCAKSGAAREKAVHELQATRYKSLRGNRSQNGREGAGSQT